MRRWILTWSSLTGFLATTILILFFSQAGARLDARPAGEVPPVTSPAAPSDTFINVCSQHAALCPVDATHWQGEPDGWQTTGKKWIRHSGTPSSIDVMWEFSFPYQGGNPAYTGHRDNPYDDYTNTPDGWPAVPGPPPVTFEWERWDVAGGGQNYTIFQYAGTDEHSSHFVGQTDCTGGSFFPVTNEHVTYARADLAVQRGAECATGGYIAVQQLERWGEPRSLTRIAACDDPARGIPASQVPLGNMACKISPYVGVVYQRYAWAPATTPPHDRPVLGCEVAVYAWGWPEWQPIDATGHDYQSWFRNGELRFSRWLSLSAGMTTVPAPDDDGWWNPRCDPAWASLTNWIYTGRYQIGTTLFTDTLDTVLPAATTVITTSGRAYTSVLDFNRFDFAPGTFAVPVLFTQTLYLQNTLPPTGRLAGSNQQFGLTTVFSATGQPAAPGRPYTVTVHYTAPGIGLVHETSLALYRWDGAGWQMVPGSVVDPAANQVMAPISQAGRYALLGEPARLFVPAINQP